MNKKVILLISIVINIALGIALLYFGTRAVEELKFNYVERDTMHPDSLRKYLGWEYYGVAANLSHPIRGGAQIAEEDLDYYMLGEYADLLFFKEVYAEAGNAELAGSCEKRLGEIRSALPQYETLLDKIELSAEKALWKQEGETDG